MSSSDGHRFGRQASARLGSRSPRSCGYDAQALPVYTPIADPPRVVHTQVIAGSVREALCVLAGWLNNATVLRPQEPLVAQHGCTDQRLGLCPLLGFPCMPRRNVRKPTLDKLDRPPSYGPLDDVIPRTVDTALIRAQWEQLGRVAAARRHRTAPRRSCDGVGPAAPRLSAWPRR